MRLISGQGVVNTCPMDAPSKGRSNAARKIHRYLSHITINAVLCLQVLGGRMLHTPCLPRLQVIVIAPPVAG